MSNPRILFAFLPILSVALCEDWKFPPNFKFGVATSAFQIEGGWNADGKGPSIWDEKIHSNPALVADSNNADIACDSYNKYEEDIKMLKELGVDIYRFSLSWSRILPRGYVNKVNQAGIDYYNKLINGLIANGIEPVVSIFHWDLPQMFGPLGGWMNPEIVDLYADYARLVFKHFGDRVKTWLTFNEPRLVCQIYKGLVYIGNFSEFPTGWSEYLCIHHILKSHAEAYHIYNKEFRFKQKGRISITLDITWSEPDSTKKEDQEAAERQRQFEFGIFAHPILKQDYPLIVKDRVWKRSKMEGLPKSRLPSFTFAEIMKIRGTYDFLGVNHYITIKTRDTPEFSLDEQSSLQADMRVYQYFDPSWPDTASAWSKVTPWGMRSALKWVKESYGNVEVLITESGCSEATGTLDDKLRIEYLRKYMNATLQAIYIDKVNVTSYMVWSLMDNFEWQHGYTKRYGLYHVDFNSPNRTRTQRQSAKYLRDVINLRTLA